MQEETRTPELKDIVAFMKMMGLNTLTTEKDFYGYRFYMTVEPIQEEEKES